MELKDIRQLTDQIGLEVREQLKTQLLLIMGSILVALQSQSPYVTGEHANSWTPYGEEGPAAALPFAQGNTQPQSLEKIRQALSGWEVGGSAGIASADPAAVKLNFGFSDQADTLWVLSAILAGLKNVPEGTGA